LGEIHIANEREYMTIGAEIRFHQPISVPDDLDINLLNFKEVLRAD
jgi:hypothetical protein